MDNPHNSGNEPKRNVLLLIPVVIPVEIRPFGVAVNETCRRKNIIPRLSLPMVASLINFVPLFSHFSSRPWDTDLEPRVAVVGPRSWWYDCFFCMKYSNLISSHFFFRTRAVFLGRFSPLCWLFGFLQTLPLLETLLETGSKVECAFLWLF